MRQYAIVAATLLSLSAMAGAIQPTTQPATSPGGDIAKLIEELGHERWKVRDAAQKKLRVLRDAAVIPALRQAAESKDPEVSIRAKLLLAELLNFTHVIVDALGQPIADATITVVFGEAKRPPAVFKTNIFGGISLSAEAGRRGSRMRFHHPEFGLAEGSVPRSRPTTPDASHVAVEFRVPMVREGTKARSRALKGVIVGPDDKPVAGAWIDCTIVRTPGEGLIQNSNNLPEILTDAQGRFAVYVPDPDPRNERGRLIPPKSRYYVGVRAEKAGLFPYCGKHYNTREETIRLGRPEKFHRFEFEASGGGRLTGSQLQHVRVTYHPLNGGGESVALGASYVKEGGKLLPGHYVATSTPGEVRYQPIEVAKDSPETLLFRLPPPVTYRGRVVDGATGEPLAGAFVFGYYTVELGNLAAMTDKDWKQLEALPAKPSLDDPGLSSLRKHYQVLMIARTDGQGRYDLSLPPGRKCHSLMACARDRLPCSHRAFGLTPNNKVIAPVSDLPLFPAARIMVKPIVEGHASISPKWQFTDGNQPEWLKRLKASTSRWRSKAHVEYVHWLPLNESQPIFVPAGVELTLRFEAPSDEQLCAGKCDKVIRLAAGKSMDIGEVTFAKAFLVTVQVVDQAGKGVEGAPVRRRYDTTRIGSIVHNTDEKGLAQFFVERDSKGQFGLFDLPRGPAGKADDAPLTAFEVSDKAPIKSFVIRLTPTQIKALGGS